MKEKGTKAACAIGWEDPADSLPERNEFKCSSIFVICLVLTEKGFLSVPDTLPLGCMETELFSASLWAKGLDKKQIKILSSKLPFLKSLSSSRNLLRTRRTSFLLRNVQSWQKQWKYNGAMFVYVTLKTPDLYISTLTVSGYTWSVNDNICWWKTLRWRGASLTLVTSSFERIWEGRGVPPTLLSMRRWSQTLKFC